MRIISGKYKARRIEAPRNITARPTTDFAKEGLFNVLNNEIDFAGIDVLDLFAGTGSIGFEFVSRGANSVISVEKSELHVNFIRKVIKILDIDNITLIKGDVLRYVESVKIKFDVIFADPPYQLANLVQIPNFIFSNQLLREDGIFILEHSSKYNFENHLHFLHHRNYGNVHFTFFR
ncbi:MAG: 16S rRNA (guanine(966)-N(2))-methyltransferase RsmD [Paludibacteraceae bacterium]